MFLAILFSAYLIWSFKDRFSSSKTPRKFIDFTLSTLCFLISNLVNKWGRSSFLLGLWKREYFLFPMLRESLFASNHLLIFCSSLLTRENKVLSPYAHKKDSCRLQTLLCQALMNCGDTHSHTTGGVMVSILSPAEPRNRYP